MALQSSTAERPKESNARRQDNRPLCRYTNDTRQIQIIRMTNLPDDFLERAVLPGNQILFAASADAELEVYTYDIATAILAERMTCDRLATYESLEHSR